MTITISGMSNNIIIEKGEFAHNENHIEISGMSNHKTFYVSDKQQVRLFISGMSNNIYVSKYIAKNVVIVEESGQSNKLIYK